MVDLDFLLVWLKMRFRDSVWIGLLIAMTALSSSSVGSAPLRFAATEMPKPWSDVDMKNREIHVGGQLVYYEGDDCLLYTSFLIIPHISKSVRHWVYVPVYRLHI